MNLLQRRSENLINFINSRQYVQLDQGLKDSDMFMCETMKDKIDEEGQLRIEKAKRRLN